MKKIQSVLCALVLALSLSSAVFAGDIHGTKAAGDIHGVKSNGILISDLFAWGDITGLLGILIGV